MEHLDPSGEKELSSRIAHYESVASRALKKYGKEFRRFARKEKKLAELGDHLLKNRLCTGYNILLDSAAMQLDSEEKMIFYSNYIGRTKHFGTLLAMIEKEGLITEKGVSYGAKASRVLYDERWEVPGSQDEKIVEMKFIDPSGKQMKQNVDETMETVMTFRPKDDKTALKIVERLFDLTWKDSPVSIPGGWSIPDIRATHSLKQILIYGKIDFHDAIANIFSRDEARLVVLRKMTGFSFPWESFPIGINYELAEFLTAFGVGP